MSKQPYDLEAILCETTKLQGRAANPESSAFVSANAGTGKTYILVNRVLRLMLAGAEPFRILCLTYTKAAAAEMENRLFETLSKWVTMPEAELSAALKKLIHNQPKAEDLESARRLFARAIETPGGMQVQTIHGFCEKLLQRFPLEADVPPHFKVLDDQLASELKTKARETVLTAALNNPTGSDAAALQTIIAYSTDVQFEELINTALQQRSIWGGAISEAEDSFLNQLGEILDLPEERDQSVWLNRMAESIAEPLAHSLTAELQDAGGKTNLTAAAALGAWLQAAGNTAKVEALQGLFLTGTNELRKRLYTKALSDNHPALAAAFTTAQAEFHNSFRNHETLTVAYATTSLIHLADKITTQYEAQKRQRAALDFQDLIEHTAQLLTSRSDTAWVLYKLDRGIEHILVDEAQDTSPEQWQVIESLTQEFFSGEGATETPRTLFAVGDEKQSIYGFQGAEPRQFSEMASRFEKSAALSEKRFERIPLNLSFRSTKAVLGAVDLVFKNPDLISALTMSGEGITHHAKRENEPGLIEIWPVMQPESQQESDPFDPLSEQGGTAVNQQLAEKIAKTIRRWIDDGEWLASKGRAIEAGDILILLRKRNPFAPLIIRALKAEGIPVAGADRITITEQIAVMDMLALGDFLMLPENDLALASLLKSPIFNLDDDDLFKLSHNRKGSLWQSLRYFAKREPRYEPVASELSRWLSRADILPPFEFFANLLEGEGLRQKFIARLGAVAGDALDEFINLTLNYDEQEPPTLQGFLDLVRRNKAEVKRDMDKGRNEVRVMTVHGAKGLEAEIVFLPDTCSTGSANKSETLLTTRSGAAPDSKFANRILWAPSGKGHLDVVTEIRGHRKEAEREEQLRLLYVALTRARDRLYVAGATNSRNPASGCWYNLITEGLEGELTRHKSDDGSEVWRLETGEPVSKRDDGDEKIKPATASITRPGWMNEPAINEPIRTIPAAPSSILPYEVPEDDEDKIPQEPAMLSPRALGKDARFLRGRLVHKLLEHLPGLTGQDRDKAAKTLASHHGRELTEPAKTAILKEVNAILDHPDYQTLFGPNSEAEVTLIAKLNGQQPGKSPILLSGQIDRLVVSENEVMIIDYKSNRPSPRDINEVAPAYLAQLAAYRVALKQIYPKHEMRAILLWTDGPYLMEIPNSRLIEYDKLLNQT